MSQQLRTVESISNSARPIPFLTEEHWKAYPDLKGSQITDFLALVRNGKPARIDKPAEGQDLKAFDQEHQRGEFLTSIARCNPKRSIGVGLTHISRLAVIESPYLGNRGRRELPAEIGTNGG